MAKRAALSVKGIYKSFRLPHEQSSGIKQLIVNIFRRSRGYEMQHVLHDVNFEIEEGEFFGIVGRNGSGKSTLLKLIAGIYSPDKGAVTVNGSLTPFIELGVGFNPELTGRENVFLNGALLGFSRHEMEDMYDEIVSFAELGKFMDQKLKNYSSGMQVRLAFSIAIRAKSDILLLDEVLAVGDEAFQKKCIDIFENYKTKGQTIVLVTHDMNIVKEFCTKAILVKDGRVADIGSPNRIANKYAELNGEEITRQIEEENRHKSAHEAGVKATLKSSSLVSYGTKASLEVKWPNDRSDIKNIGVAIYKKTGEYVFGTNTIVDNITIKGNSLVYAPVLSLGPGNYYYKIGFFGKTDKEVREFIEEGPDFSIKSANIGWQGIVNVEHEWNTK
jgi:ABC-2 type transport system ATP-binding protein